ncbi:hypothetical protein [Flavobacterium selenitireducens]|uniref:hypothetical protein n=1 Tax=Flavobacterium selenitireducens TaxID=2722704 RepID=UPI00168B625D|nr:hypothetical protein [Flavobacterium selenitireducens]MBD3582045.1 hypothetical protein [Flavobacterium selenitireducens]
MKYWIVSILFIFSSCATMAKKIKGVKSPRLESAHSVNAYLQRNAIDTTEVYVFKDLMAFATASQAKYLSFPNAYFFNADGFAVDYPRTTEHCNAQVNSFIADLRNFSSWPSDKNRLMKDFTAFLAPDFQPKQAANISVFITFTTYAGKLNHEKAFEWIALLETAKQNGVSVNYYLVSGDFMRNWNIPESLRKKWGIKN